MFATSPPWFHMMQNPGNAEYPWLSVTDYPVLEGEREKEKSWWTKELAIETTQILHDFAVATPTTLWIIEMPVKEIKEKTAVAGCQAKTEGNSSDWLVRNLQKGLKRAMQLSILIYIIACWRLQSIMIFSDPPHRLLSWERCCSQVVYVSSLHPDRLKCRSFAQIDAWLNLAAWKGWNVQTMWHHATMIWDTELGDISNTINTQESFKCFRNLTP